MISQATINNFSANFMEASAVGTVAGTMAGFCATLCCCSVKQGLQSGVDLGLIAGVSVFASKVFQELLIVDPETATPEAKVVISTIGGVVGGLIAIKLFAKPKD